MMRQTQQLLTVDQASAKLGLRPTTIRRKILERRIPFVKLGKAVRIPIEAIEKMIAEGWREPVAK